MTETNLAGKNILVTGGSLGIGYATAETCLKAGAKVAICARNPVDLEAAVRKLNEQGYDAIAGIPADVTQQDQVDAALDAVESHFGTVSAVIHAAGILGPIGDITQVDPVEWFNTIQVNLFGAVLVTRQACLRLQKTGGGRIVLFSGGGAAYAFPNYSAYACSKVGVVRFTETIAQEMAASQIEINCVAPGFVITRLHQQTLAAGELAGKEYLEKTKAEIDKGGVSPYVGAAAAAFLASDAANGITGKFVAAPYDGWNEWSDHLEELRDTDIFTLRRILPKERGMNWQ
ncbi:SDR family oxidoreductase [Phormidium tenue FACHB-886]|nr:SDR family oxidoreductase [Phormidium tenue FACHB-886]